jgi:DNA-binding NarL/FixJ family response regulator
LAIRILVADDHRMISDAMGNLLTGEPDIEVIAAVYEWDEALRLAKERAADVAVVALNMLRTNGFKPCRQLASAAPQCKIIALAIQSERRYPADAFQAGVMGYILKESTSCELVTAIRSVAGNYRYLDRRVNDVIIYQDKPHPQTNQSHNKPQLLTEREREILKLMTEGKNNADITSELDISIKTFETHRRHILKKLRLSNLAELTRFAIREGISPL